MSTVKRWNGTTWEYLTSSAAIGTTAGTVAAGDHQHTASNVTNTPSGNISATTMQAAIEELDSEKEPAFSKNTAFNKNYSTTTTDIKMNGAQSLGVLDTLPRADHVHPTDTSREASGTTATHAALTATHGVSGAIVGTNNAQTLINKTLVSPAISSVVNTGTLTLPTSTDTLVGRTTTDTLTNKTISGYNNTITNVSLATGVADTLPVANGGTGATTFTANYLLKGNGTNAVTASSVYEDANGNLGIGVSSPAAKLDVATTTGFTFNALSTAGIHFGTADTQGGSLMVRTASLNSSYGSGLAIDGTYAGDTKKSTINIKAFGVYSGGGYHSDLAFSTSYGVIISEAMRLTSSGNLLIGTTIDDGVNKLQVNGSGYFTGGISVSGKTKTTWLEFGLDSDVTVTDNYFTAFKYVSNTSVQMLLRGSDGVTRACTLTFS